MRPVEDLKYVWRLGYRQVKLNINSLPVVQIIRDKRTSSSDYRAFFDQANLFYYAIGLCDTKSTLMVMY
jgi:hypothetical protein